MDRRGDRVRRTTTQVDALGELSVVDGREFFWDSAAFAGAPVLAGDSPVLTVGPVTGIGSTWVAPGWRTAERSGAVSGGVGGAATGGYQYATGPGPHSAAGFLGATAQGGGTGAVFGSLGGAASHGITNVGSKLLSSVRTVPEAPNETFDRTMHPDHYAELVQTGRVPATHETFISSNPEYASRYSGVIVTVAE